jgi:hypothetical protein
MQITMDGKYQTRDGRAVRILATDLKSGDASIIGLVMGANGAELPACWRTSGRTLEMGVTTSEGDLVPVPTKHEGWMFVSIEGNPVGNIYPTEKEAEDWAASIWKWHLGFIYLSHVTWED